MAIIIIVIAGLFALVLFAPIPDVAKYVALGLLLACLMGVWFQFWNKAKHEPLSATEEYYIEELRLRHIGADYERSSIEQIESDPRLLRGEVRQSAQRSEEDGRQP